MLLQCLISILSQTRAAWEPAPRKWRQTCRDSPVAIPVEECSSLFWWLLALDECGLLWTGLGSPDGVGLSWMYRFWLFCADSHPIEILEYFQSYSIAQCYSNSRNCSGRFWRISDGVGLLWTVQDCLGMHVQAFESFQLLWESSARAALESSQELARSRWMSELMLSQTLGMKFS